MEDAPTLLKLPKSENSDTRKRLPRRDWPKSGQSIAEPVVPLETISTDTQRLDSCGKESSQRLRIKMHGRKAPTWECLFAHRQQGLFPVGVQRHDGR